jgi:uncharacterized membrane-anchored protein
MEKRTKNGIIVTLFIAAIGYFAYKAFAKPTPSNIPPKDKDSGTTNQDNFDKVASNLNVAKNGADYLTYYFNGKKNIFVFYNNNRMYIADDKGNIISMGTYSDGGKSIVLDNGKSANGSSVWTNLLKLLK